MHAVDKLRMQLRCLDESMCCCENMTSGVGFIHTLATNSTLLSTAALAATCLLSLTLIAHATFTAGSGSRRLIARH